MAEDTDGQADQTGTLFVDILFALVVAEILTPLKTPEYITGPGGAHLVVAFTLTILSWVGYHNSKSRADARIRFPTSTKLDRLKRHPHNNWEYFAFKQFVLDVLMVIVYWLAAITFESSAYSTRRSHWFWPTGASAVPEALAVSASFVLYAVWDFIGRQEVRRRLDRAVTEDEATAALRRTQVRRERRRWPTLKCGASALALLLVAFVWSDTPGVYVVDGLLVVILVLYRYRKEVVVADLADG